MVKVEGMKLQERVLNQVSQLELTSKLEELTKLGFPLPQGFGNISRQTSETCPAL